MQVHGKQYKLAFIATFGAFALLNSSAAAQRGGQLTIPAPTITEYKPHSTLVVPEHKVPRAKFPAVDFHGHPPALTSPENIKTVISAMDRLNLRVMVQANPSSGERLTSQIAAVKAAGFADRFVFFASLDFRNVGPGLRRKDRRAARGGREGRRGRHRRDHEGLRALHPQSRRLAPRHGRSGARCRVGDGGRTRNTGVRPHGGSGGVLQPIDYKNERWLEMALYESRRFFDRSRFPSFEDLMAERDRMIAKHPNTKWVVAHMSWYANDLGKLGKMFDRYPNVYTELGAILYDLGRQPRFAREFFVKYQDRILFGKDAFEPDEYPYYWRVFETADEYFDYYRDYHAFWKLYGLDLPDEVLQKVYYGNALKIIPRMPTAGFPRVSAR